MHYIAVTQIDASRWTILTVSIFFVAVLTCFILDGLVPGFSSTCMMYAIHATKSYRSILGLRGISNQWKHLQGNSVLRSFPRAVSTSLSTKKLKCPPIVYVSGEEMTRYAMQLILDQWIEPNVDISQWEFYDLSCKSRDDTEDQVLRDVIEAGKRIGSIFKEPTVTPTAEQKERLGLRKAWGSPNGAMRRGWRGITISRDTIHITGKTVC